MNQRVGPWCQSRRRCFVWQRRDVSSSLSRNLYSRPRALDMISCHCIPQEWRFSICKTGPIVKLQLKSCCKRFLWIPNIKCPYYLTALTEIGVLRYYSRLRDKCRLCKQEKTAAHLFLWEMLFAFYSCCILRFADIRFMVLNMKDCLTYLKISTNVMYFVMCICSCL